MPIYWRDLEFIIHTNVWRIFFSLDGDGAAFLVLRLCGVFFVWVVLGLCVTRLAERPIGDFAGRSILLIVVMPPFIISVLACLPSIYCYVLSASVFCALI